MGMTTRNLDTPPLMGIVNSTSTEGIERLFFLSIPRPQLRFYPTKIDCPSPPVPISISSSWPPSDPLLELSAPSQGRLPFDPEPSSLAPWPRSARLLRSPSPT